MTPEDVLSELINDKRMWEVLTDWNRFAKDLEVVEGWNDSSGKEKEKDSRQLRFKVVLTTWMGTWSARNNKSQKITRVGDTIRLTEVDKLTGIPYVRGINVTTTWVLRPSPEEVNRATTAKVYVKVEFDRSRLVAAQMKIFDARIRGIIESAAGHLASNMLIVSPAQ
ncbi:unnamed protein product [Chrysoparadoxa australica]